jgi:hypothetical protein
MHVLYIELAGALLARLIERAIFAALEWHRRPKA